MTNSLKDVKANPTFMDGEVHPECGKPDVDPEWWIGGDAATRIEQAAGFRRAKRVCQGCPLRDQCLQWAVEHQQNGVWGAERLSRGRIVSHARV